MFKVVKKRTLAWELFLWAVYGVVVWTSVEMLLL